MARILPMPKLSDTMEEGQIASWLKKEGDQVDEGEPLAEIETDKATMEYESGEEGVLLKILVAPGDKAGVGEPMAVFGESGEKIDLEKILASSPNGSAATPPPQERSLTTTSAPSNAPAPAAAPAPAPAAAPTSATGGRLRASPLAKKIAKEKGVDLSSVSGSGPNGRIVVRDLDNVSGGGAPQPGAAPVTSGEDRLIKASMMRQTIAKRLHAAKNEAPHFYLTRSVDMTRCNEWRKGLNAEIERNPELVKVSVNDLILLACAKALRKHPTVNSSWEGEQIREFGNVHVAMAVALPTGLVTPVVRYTDQIGVREIARQTKDLAKRARAGELSNADYTGGTFTVSNLGMMGIESFTAVINPPQAAILAVGATVPTPAVDSSGGLVVKPEMKMTLSCDHRVVDGMVGAAFLQTLVQYLEDPLLMLA